MKILKSFVKVAEKVMCGGNRAARCLNLGHFITTNNQIFTEVTRSPKQIEYKEEVEATVCPISEMGFTGAAQ